MAHAKASPAGGTRLADCYAATSTQVTTAWLASVAPRPCVDSTHPPAPFRMGHYTTLNRTQAAESCTHSAPRGLLLCSTVSDASMRPHSSSLQHLINLAAPRLCAGCRLLNLVTLDLGGSSARLAPVCTHLLTNAVAALTRCHSSSLDLENAQLRHAFSSHLALSDASLHMRPSIYLSQRLPFLWCALAKWVHTARCGFMLPNAMTRWLISSFLYLSNAQLPVLNAQLFGALLGALSLEPPPSLSL